MKVERRKNSIERRILIAMIVDRNVLGHIANKWEDNGLFKSSWSNLIGDWCCSYYERYQRAPGRAVEGLFESWASENNDQDTIALIDKFLSSLSGEYVQLRKDSNTDYILDQANNLFNQVKIRKLIETLQGDLDTGQIEKAQKRIEVHDRIEVAETGGTFILEDEDSIRQAFEQRSDSLIRYKGALGNFIGNAFERDGFISFMGPEKRGKSWALMDVGWRGMEQSRKVAFFAIGDMSKNQMLLRFMTRASRRPLNATKDDELTKIPISMEYTPGDAQATVEYKSKRYEQPLNWKEAWNNCQRIVQKRGSKLLRMSCHPNSSITATGILGVIRTWERKDWVPDVIVIDYADLIAPEPGYTDSRDQINATWKKLRAISQMYHCLVVTATQSDAASYDTELLTMKNFSEDKRKFAHVTGMIGVNQSKAEKKADVMRWNWLALRESPFSEDTCIYIAGCRDIANPTILSTF